MASAWASTGRVSAKKLRLPDFKLALQSGACTKWEVTLVGLTIQLGSASLSASNPLVQFSRSLDLDALSKHSFFVYAYLQAASSSETSV